jgi:hypothetical protein
MDHVGGTRVDLKCCGCGWKAATKRLQVDRNWIIKARDSRSYFVLIDAVDVE